MQRVLTLILIVWTLSPGVRAEDTAPPDAPAAAAPEAPAEAPAAAPAETPAAAPEAPAAEQGTAPPAEDSTAPPPAPAPSTAAPAAEGGEPAPITDAVETMDPNDRKAYLKRRLSEKLSKMGDHTARFVVLTPLDYSDNKVGPAIAGVIAEDLKRLGAADVTESKIVLSALTMEEMRIAMIRAKADAIVVAVVKNESLDIFLYDRRNPFYIFAHSEPIDETQAKIEDDTARQLAYTVLRKLMARYANDQFYELPRAESPHVLKEELPKWLTDKQIVKMLNREIAGHWTLGAHLGSALLRATNGAFESMPMVGVQAGYRLSRRTFAEVEYDAFSYNLFIADVKYLWRNPSQLYQIAFSFGFAYATRKLAWILDDTPAFGSQASFFAPGVHLQFPIGDIFLKCDLRMFVPETMDRFLFTFTPGLIAYF